MDEDLKELVWLRSKIIADFPTFDWKICDRGRFLKLTQSEDFCLKYLPGFHLIISFLGGTQKFCSRLITYHGRSLDTFVFECIDKMLPEKIVSVLKNLSQTLKLCQGVDAFKAVKCEDSLIEYLHDALVARHKKCKFLITSENEDLICEKCHMLFNVKKEVDIKSLEEDDNTSSDVFNIPDRPPQVKNERLGLNLVVEPQMAEYGEFYDNSYDDSYDNSYDDIMDNSYHNDEEDNDNDASWVPEPEVKRNSSGSERRKRGRPAKPKVPNFVSSNRTRGRPRLIVPPNEIRRPVAVKNTATKKIGPSGALRCKICLKAYISEPAINRHFHTHEKYFDVKGTLECPLCKETIPKLDLTSHFDAVHSTKDNPQTCCLGCLEVMPHKNGDTLRTHIFSSHQQQNMCEICGKVFNWVKRLECHVKTQHSDVKEVFCDRCGKGFGHELALQKHVQV